MNDPSPLTCGLAIAGFQASTVTLIEGSSRFVRELLLQLCACTAGRLDRHVVFVDGGNSFNPYTLRSVSRVLQVDAGMVLGKVHIARAFTEYQMHDLLTQQLVPVIRKLDPAVLAVAYLPHLFGETHSRKLLEQSVERVKEITGTHRLTTIITSYGGTWWGARLVEERADRVIRVVQRRKLIRIMDEHDVVECVPIPAGQMQLDTYLEAV